VCESPRKRITAGWRVSCAGAVLAVLIMEPANPAANNHNVVTENIRVIIRGRPLDAQLSNSAGIINNPNYLINTTSNNNLSDVICNFHLPTRQVSIVKDIDKYQANSSSNNPLNVILPTDSLRFAYDCLLPPSSTQVDIFDQCKSLLDSVCAGYNSTIFAYGQSGSGKTFTMEGSGIAGTLDSGILPNSVDYIFNTIQANSSGSKQYLVHCSYVEIYNEVIHDLLADEKIVTICETKGEGHNAAQNSTGFALKDAADIPCKNSAEVLELLKQGSKRRRMAGTQLNERSSRSHAIFICVVECSTWLSDDTNIIKKGRLNLVDLAGSERLSQSKVEGVHKREASNINQSLFALGRCISALVKQQSVSSNSGHEFIPYRTSKLTMLLKDSLGGGSKTLMIGCIRCERAYYDSTLSTLRFAEKLKQIKNQPIINEDPRDSMLRKLQEELEEMKKQLQQHKSTPNNIQQLINNDIAHFIVDTNGDGSRAFLNKFLTLARAAGATNNSENHNHAKDSSDATVRVKRRRRRALSASATDLSELTLQATAAAAQLDVLHANHSTSSGSIGESSSFTLSPPILSVSLASLTQKTGSSSAAQNNPRSAAVRSVGVAAAKAAAAAAQAKQSKTDGAHSNPNKGGQRALPSSPFLAESFYNTSLSIQTADAAGEQSSLLFSPFALDYDSIIKFHDSLTAAKPANSTQLNKAKLNPSHPSLFPAAAPITFHTPPSSSLAPRPIDSSKQEEQEQNGIGCLPTAQLTTVDNAVQKLHNPPSSNEVTLSQQPVVAESVALPVSPAAPEIKAAWNDSTAQTTPSSLLNPVPPVAAIDQIPRPEFALKTVEEQLAVTLPMAAVIPAPLPLAAPLFPPLLNSYVRSGLSSSQLLRSRLELAKSELAALQQQAARDRAASNHLLQIKLKLIKLEKELTRAELAKKFKKNQQNIEKLEAEAGSTKSSSASLPQNAPLAVELFFYSCLDRLLHEQTLVKAHLASKIG
jgi:hypothetical protein